MEKIKVKITGFQMLSHLSLVNCHSMLSKSIISCHFNLRFDNKEIIQETHTKKNRNSGKFGKSKSFYYLNEFNSPIFDNIQDLLNHYNLSILD